MQQLVHALQLSPPTSLTRIKLIRPPPPIPRAATHLTDRGRDIELPEEASAALLVVDPDTLPPLRLHPAEIGQGAVENGGNDVKPLGMVAHQLAAVLLLQTGEDDGNIRRRSPRHT